MKTETRTETKMNKQTNIEKKDRKEKARQSGT